MRKDAKRASKSTQAKKKTDVKDLAVKNPAAVKGGKVAVHDISITKFSDKSSASLL
jgi:type VI protein secretion system component Hcp